MPAEGIDKQADATSTHEETAFNSLSLQQADCCSSPQRCSSPEVQTAKSLTAKGSLPEPSAPAACTSPKIQSHPAKAGSRAAIGTQASKSPFAQSVARQFGARPAVRKSADAVLVTARSGSSSNPKLSAFRQARQHKNLQASPASAADIVDDIIAATRRSRMRIDKIGINHDSAHERRRVEIYALNTILRASEEAKLQHLIQQHASMEEAGPAEQERMVTLAALPDSDDDKYQGNSPRSAKSGTLHKV